jgi:hypothetical protein
MHSYTQNQDPQFSQQLRLRHFRQPLAAFLWRIRFAAAF